MSAEAQNSSGLAPESPRQVSARAAPGDRLLWADAARGVAILWIMGVHFISTWGEPAPFTGYLREFVSPATGLTDRLANLFMAGLRLGWQGVDIFVVLSGFVLTLSHLSETRHRSYLSWLARRAVRIYPMYWAAIVGTIAIWCWSFRSMSFDWSQMPSRFDIVTHAAGLHVIWKSTFSSICPAWWFIGLILQLYLVFPFLVRAHARIGNARFLCAAAAFCLMARLAIPPLLAGAETIEHRGFFGYAIFQFATGMVLARVWVDGQRDQLIARILRHRALLGAVYLIWILAKYLGFSRLLLMPFATTAIALLFIETLRRLKGSVLVAALARIGTYSYALYLIHEPLQPRILGPSSQQSLAEASARLAVYFLAVSIGAVLLTSWGAFASRRLRSLRRTQQVTEGAASRPSPKGDGASPGSEPVVHYPQL